MPTKAPVREPDVSDLDELCASRFVSIIGRQHVLPERFLDRNLSSVIGRSPTAGNSMEIGTIAPPATISRRVGWLEGRKLLSSRLLDILIYRAADIAGFSPAGARPKRPTTISAQPSVSMFLNFRKMLPPLGTLQLPQGSKF